MSINKAVCTRQGLGLCTTALKVCMLVHFLLNELENQWEARLAVESHRFISCTVMISFNITQQKSSVDVICLRHGWNKKKTISVVLSIYQLLNPIKYKICAYLA